MLSLETCLRSRNSEDISQDSSLDRIKEQRNARRNTYIEIVIHLGSDSVVVWGVVIPKRHQHLLAKSPVKGIYFQMKAVRVPWIHLILLITQISTFRKGINRKIIVCLILRTINQFVFLRSMFSGSSPESKDCTTHCQ